MKRHRNLGDSGSDFRVSENLSGQGFLSLSMCPVSKGKKSYLPWKFWNFRLLAVYLSLSVDV